MLLNNPESLFNIDEFGYFHMGYPQAWLYCFVLVAATLFISALLYSYVEGRGGQLTISTAKKIQITSRLSFHSI